jgi:hypothetical protein
VGLVKRTQQAGGLAGVEFGKQTANRIGLNHGGVARHNDYWATGLCDLVMRHLHRVAGAQAFGLIDEFEILPIAKRGSDIVGPVANHHDDFLYTRSDECVEDVLDHGSSQGRAKDLGEVRSHPRSHPGRQYHRHGIIHWRYLKRVGNWAAFC